MSVLLFNIVDWIVGDTSNVSIVRRGIRWKLIKVLEDLYSADDIALLSSLREGYKKSSRLHQVSRYTGFCITNIKTKVLDRKSVV